MQPTGNTHTLSQIVQVGVDLNEECFSGVFQYFTEGSGGFTEKKWEKAAEKVTTPKNDVLKFSRFSRKFRCKALDDRAAPPLELCHHSRAHKSGKGRAQGHSHVIAKRRRRNIFLGSRGRVHKVTAPRWPTD